MDRSVRGVYNFPSDMLRLRSQLNELKAKVLHSLYASLSVGDVFVVADDICGEHCIRIIQIDGMSDDHASREVLIKLGEVDVLVDMLRDAKNRS